MRVVRMVVTAGFVISALLPSSVLYALDDSIVPVSDAAVNTSSSQDILETSALEPIVSPASPANEPLAQESIVPPTVTETLPPQSTEVAQNIIEPVSVQPIEQQLVVQAEVPTKILITKVQIGSLDDSGAEKPADEFVELFNPGDEPVIMSDWRLEYLTATHDGGLTPTRLLASLTTTLEPQSFYIVKHAGYALNDADKTFFGLTNTTTNNPTAGALAKTGGSVRLVQADGSLVDLAGWGTAKQFQTQAFKADGLTAWQRCIEASGSARDTSNNAQDFNLYQTVSPRQIPLCVLPEEPKPINMCDSILLSEIAANVPDEQQFVELYNQTDQPVTLHGCQLTTNRSTTKSYIFNEAQIISPLGHLAVYIKDTPLTLTKTTTGTVYLLASDGLSELDSQNYDSLKQNSSWMRQNDGVWQQSFALTPGQENVWQEFLPCEVGYERNFDTGRCRLIPQAATVTDCGEGKERNVETNRCRSIVVVTALTACKAGQYRNPETNRCRALGTTATALKPCTADQYRNTDTNRCRNITTTTGLAACKEGQERNPETNRCRNATLTTAASYAVQNTPTPESVKLGWIIAGLVGLVAAMYAVYEWRFEIARGFRTFVQKASRR